MSRRAQLFLALLLVLFCAGGLMIFDVETAASLDKTLFYSSKALLRHLLYGGIAFLAALFLWKVPVERLLELSPKLLFVFTLLLLLVLIPPFGAQVNGAKRWFRFGPVAFQPSEFVRYLVPLYLTHVFCSAPFTVKRFLRAMAVVFVPVLLILVEPDHGMAIILFSGIAALLFLIGIKWRYWALPLLLLLGLGALFASQMPYVRQRLAVYIDPESDIRGKGHQPYQAKIAAGSGGVYGKGLGESIQKFAYLPEAMNDYIAAIFAEECGFLGVATLLSAYALLAFLGMKMAQEAHSYSCGLVASTFIFLLVFQAFLNLGVVSGLLPSKGTILPFFSQGGSSLVAHTLAATVILKVGSAKEGSCCTTPTT